MRQNFHYFTLENLCLIVGGGLCSVPCHVRPITDIAKPCVGGSHRLYSQGQSLQEINQKLLRQRLLGEEQ